MHLSGYDVNHSFKHGSVTLKANYIGEMLALMARRGYSDIALKHLWKVDSDHSIQEQNSLHFSSSARTISTGFYSSSLCRHQGMWHGGRLRKKNMKQFTTSRIVNYKKSVNTR